MKFSRFVFNLKKHNFREDVFNECRSQILTFIKEHPESILDSTHLEERLKKLLAFT
jgi:6-phosphogluconate dehydrogenase